MSSFLTLLTATSSSTNGSGPRSQGQLTGSPSEAVPLPHVALPLQGHCRKAAPTEEDEANITHEEFLAQGLEHPRACIMRSKHAVLRRERQGFSAKFKPMPST